MSDLKYACTNCGQPCWMGLNPHCVNRDCQWFDRDAWVDWVMSEPDPGDPPDSAEDLPFRDFCQHCHTSQDFQRYMDQFTDMHAFCPACGLPNFWASSGIENDKTDPMGWQFGLPGFKP